jgi:hypothetical protein
MTDDTAFQSIPDFMDLDLDPELPEELLDVNNEFIDEYLRRVRGAYLKQVAPRAGPTGRANLRTACLLLTSNLFIFVMGVRYVKRTCVLFARISRWHESAVVVSHASSFQRVHWYVQIRQCSTSNERGR